MLGACVRRMGTQVGQPGSSSELQYVLRPKERAIHRPAFQSSAGHFSYHFLGLKMPRRIRPSARRPPVPQLLRYGRPSVGGATGGHTHAQQCVWLARSCMRWAAGAAECQP